MTKFSILTLLDGLLRSQCIQGMYCKTHHLNTPGSTFVLNKDLQAWVRNPIVLKSLNAQNVDPKYKYLFIGGESVTDALEFTVAFLLLVYNYYPKFRYIFSSEEQLQIFRILCKVPKSLVIKYQKYITAELPNLYLEQEDHNKVPADFDKYFQNTYFGFTSRVKKFIQNRLYRKTGRNLRFWNSWLQGIKRACHEASDEVLYDNYVDHEETLSKKPVGTLDERVKTYMTRVSRLVKLGEPRFFEASTSASFHRKRDEGGQREDVRDWLIEKYGTKIVDEFVDDGQRHLLYGPVIPEPKIVARDIVNDFLLDGGFYKPLKVKVHGILEPLKVRKITKGEAVPYWFCRFAQKDFWGSLQKYPQFSATGRPIERADIHELIIREKRINSQVPLEFDSWISGDYSAATDGVDIRVTMGILKEILENSSLDWNMKDILMAVLGPQEIHYPKIEGKPLIKPFVQQTGQLMGSILSFPILCLINLITYWMTIEEYTGHVFEVEDLPVLVNGDDILFRANREFYDLWKENIKKVGFTMSIGKNYRHKNIFLINSQMFWLHGDPYQDYNLERIPFYNIGLLTGKAKTTGRDPLKAKPIWSWYQSVMDGSNDKWDAHKRFLYYHKEVVNQLSMEGKRNLFISRWYGGLGFKWYPELREHIKFTTYQRGLAKWYEWKLGQVGKLGQLPKKLMVRLIQEDSTSKDNPENISFKEFMDKEITSINLGFYDKYRIIPVTQPLNEFESLELKRQHNLPLLARIPSNYDKHELLVKHPNLYKFRKYVKDLIKRFNHIPLIKVEETLNKEFRVVSYTEPTISSYFSKEFSEVNSKSKLTKDDDSGKFEPYIEKTRERYLKKEETIYPVKTYHMDGTVGLKDPKRSAQLLLARISSL